MKNAQSYVSGLISFVRELLCLKHDNSHLNQSFPLVFMIVSPAITGLVRTVISVLLHIKIHPKWYTLDPDILFTMFFFPVSLLFFGVAAIHLMLRFVTGRSVNIRQLLSVFTYAQILHIIVPFIDVIGLKLGMPAGYNLNRGYVLNRFYTLNIVMTPGIVIIWAVSGYITAKTLVYRLGVDWSSTLVVILLVIPLMLFPIYIIWPTFNTVAHHLAGISVRPDMLYWGYGLYFAITAVSGMIYYGLAARVSTGVLGSL